MTGVINPALFGMPDATTTGPQAGVTLTAYTGPMTITTPGAVIENVIINGQLTVDAANVTIRNCIIQSDGWWGIEGDQAPNLTVENSKIIGGNLTNSGILGSGTFVGNDISNVSIGIQLTNGASTVSSNYIHDLFYGAADPHYDGVTALGGQNHVVIQNNTISAPDNNGTADVFIDNDFGSVNDVTVKNNLLLGGAAYTVHVDQKTGQSGTITNVVIENNYLERGYYGYIADNSNAAILNNVQWDNNSDPTPYPTLAPAVSPAAAPTITSFSTDTGVLGDHITSDNTPTLTGSAAANSTVNVFDGTTKIGTATANGSGQWTLTTPVLSDGTHNLTATDTLSGQTSAASAAFSLTIDTHVPAAPVLVSDPLVNTNQVQLSGTAEANSTVTVYDGTTVVGTGTTSSSGTWSITTKTLPSGADALTATAIDAAGTISAISQPLDPVVPPAPPPAAPTIASFSTDTGVVGDHITSDNTPTLTGGAVANSTVNVFDGTTQIGTATANGSGQWSLTTPVLSDGTHNLTATDTDTSGQTGAASAAFSVTIDTHVPAAPTLAAYSQAGAAVGSTTSLTDLVLKGTAEAGSTIDVFDGGKQIGTAATSSAGAWSFDTGTLSTGSHSYTATAIDVAGTAGTASAADVISVTTPLTPAPAPAATPIEFTNVSYSSGTATIKGTADAYSQVKLYDGTTLLGTATASANGTWSLTKSHLSNTLHTITAQELDSTGHVVETSSGAVVLAASNTSMFTGTGGDDFLFSSSSDLNDTFVFASNFGHSTIQGFTATGSGHDTVQFSNSVFDSFASVLSHASQVGQDVVISTGNETLKLLNTKLGALSGQDFHFV
jgi:hypothetical protein